ncbi:MAG: hypothetical protein B7Y36_04470 [Novosphingobium sp. 28-62-57]|uniref:hypothetical protein n=1 Tax=unclassified Novosphingobium TaxID=2644732 RepID=UPI000BCFC56D|nr:MULTISPECIES: hypothetical protein [unclassified Novosphingobium]OYW50469.1 MAG: hypothetical protein B7Z34_06445 [Novosphingobium sp. 12-62-10]OYZ11428.1 MAG: hypothetical protein B7Y36_04470 [Novosphingobium sp. 28-62-57]OZA30562.1 MAG: hypothetical protein B7X92_15860 [Novosphingobium sp. 17-62-9]HQS71063.1 hypothetical protein [Novosphingobium sp.]
MARFDASGMTISEMREFASFAPGEQRYIRRSLDIALGRGNALQRWARSGDEERSIRDQAALYAEIPMLRQLLRHVEGLDSLEPFIGPLIRLTAYDLAQDRLTGFSAYRFLYERLLGAEARPWLPGAFCGAAALPVIRPDRRRNLLQSISEAAATAHGWSTRAPMFYPEFVEAEAA